MAMNVRRIVTGHNASGKSVVKTDQRLTAVSRGVGANPLAQTLDLNLSVRNNAGIRRTTMTGTIREQSREETIPNDPKRS